MQSPTGVAVVLPVKAFHEAKQRLRPVVGDEHRLRLARHLAGGVARVVHDWGARLLVACDDDDVRGWADQIGADVAWTPGLGLNGAIDTGVQIALDDGARHVLVTHADLARPRALPGAVADGTITVVPDRHRDGTNVLSFPSDVRVAADYGPGSFRRHLASAHRLGCERGLPVRVYPDHDLGLDVDTAADLRHPSIRQEMPPWLRTHPDNHSIPAG